MKRTKILLGWIALIVIPEWMQTTSFAAESAELKTDHVTVSYTGIGQAYAAAIQKTVAAARNIAADRFGLDMPEVVYVSVSAGKGERTRLYTDGDDRIFLTVPDEDALKKPQVTGTFHLYGLCHEIGHIGMYRVIRERPWMSGAAAEGWAHYIGSRLVDEIYLREGGDLWPDAYDYRLDGMARLRKQLAASSGGETARAAGLWLDVGKIIGDKGYAALFTKWGNTEPRGSDPGASLRQSLPACGDEKELGAWWENAAPVFVQATKGSSFSAKTLESTHDLQPPEELARDDGTPSGKNSMAGGGHVVKFERGAMEAYLTGIKLYGSRYGHPTPPKENARIWLCDKDGKTISEYTVSYATFPYGRPGWVSIPVKPTALPEQFAVCIGFNPTATKGVFVHHDGSASGSSLQGLPGRTSSFTRGDWLIRAVVQRPK